MSVLLELLGGSTVYLIVSKFLGVDKYLFNR